MASLQFLDRQGRSTVEQLIDRELFAIFDGINQIRKDRIGSTAADQGTFPESVTVSNQSQGPLPIVQQRALCRYVGRITDRYGW